MSEPLTLAALVGRAGAGARDIATRDHRAAFADFAVRSPIAQDRSRLAGLSVVVWVRDMATAAAVAIDLDGFARRLLLCPSGWDAEKVVQAAATAEADALVIEEPDLSPLAFPSLVVRARWPMESRSPNESPPLATEWVLPTSGTSGAPKLAVHTLETLVGAIEPGPMQEWATFYDIRRYGGLQIFLRALAGRGSLRLAGPDEAMEDFLLRLSRSGLTHISGTPTHWRKALLCGAAGMLSPQYVRLSGEIADEAVLSGLAAAFPKARIEHAYASTEAGVVFAVGDGRPGFPAAWLDEERPARLRVVDGVLQVKTPRRALRLLGEGAPELVDADGFTDTGDMVEIRGDRCLFMGRRGGVINVGGAKVHPEEVEAVLNGLESVLASRVFARSNPITGAIVAADVVLSNPAAASRELEREIIAAALRTLPPHMAPARVRFVAELPMTDAGKLRRHG